MVLLKTRAICSLGIYMNVIKDSVHYWMIYFVSRETDIWVERGKKVRSCRKNIYFKETTTVEWIKANCALKIIIFRYFAFFLFLFFYYLFTTNLFCARFFQVRTCVPCVQVVTPLKSVHIPLNTAFVLSVTLVQNFGILYLLMLRKSSRFPVFVNISRILWLMVIILLLIPNVLRSYYLKRLFN